MNCLSPPELVTNVKGENEKELFRLAPKANGANHGLAGESVTSKRS